MPFSTDIKLPKEHPPHFPDKCVACGFTAPDSTVVIRESTMSWALFFVGLSGKRFHVQAPACRSCEKRIYLQRALRLIITTVIVIAAILIFRPYVAELFPRALQKWILLGIAILSVIPYVLYNTISPHDFDITVNEESVIYKFRNPEIAEAFSIFNLDAEWIEIDDNLS